MRMGFAGDKLMLLIRIAAILALASLAGCAATGIRPQLGQEPIPPDRLLAIEPLGVGADPADLAQIDMLALTPEMVAFLDQNLDGIGNRQARLKKLVDAIMGGDRFELIYDDSTRTARETFEDRRGNCLSFTNMFIAMARHAGLDARYQEVDVPPDWSVVGNAFLFTQHINVHVMVGPHSERIVDFNIYIFEYGFNPAYDRRIISDQRARAHYFSNIGVDRMLAGDTAEAFLSFRQAILEDRSFAPAWINLGALYRRENHPAYAETAYLQALRFQPFDPVAMSNLASLYEEQGLAEQARVYRNRVQIHRMKNPFYRYRLAQQAVSGGDYHGAIDHLKFAIRKRRNESRFYSLLSISHLMSGDREAAQHWMKRAEAVAVRESDRERYHRKLEWLMGQGTRG